LAIINFSALVNSVKGRLNSSVIGTWKGKGVIKSYNSSPSQRRSAAQQLVRMKMTEAAGLFAGLPQFSKDLWTEFASALPKPTTPLATFVAYNIRKSVVFPETVPLWNPPKEVTTPRAVSGLAVSAIGDGKLCLEWTRPTTEDTYILADRWIMAGRNNDANPPFSLAATADAADTEMAFQVCCETGTKIKVRVRVMDANYNVGPSSETLTVNVI